LWKKLKSGEFAFEGPPKKFKGTKFFPRNGHPKGIGPRKLIGVICPKPPPGGKIIKKNWVGKLPSKKLERLKTLGKFGFKEDLYKEE